MGRRSIAAAGVVAVSATAVQGLILHQTRYESYYGKGVTAANFFTDANPLIAAHPRDRVPTFAPSEAEVTFIDAVDFPHQDRPVETRIFSGVVDISECFAGDYIFRVTSDDAAHLIFDDKVLIANSDEDGHASKWAHIKMERGKQYNMQLWWGNDGGVSTLKLEYCRKTATQSEADELQEILTGGTAGGIDTALMTDAEMALAGCDFTTDISGLFKTHELPTIKRTDYNSYHGNDITYFDSNEFWAKTETKWLPEGHAHETGGVIEIHAKDSGPNQANQKSFKFEATIVPRVTGQHTFWIETDDGGWLLIDGKVVIDNNGWHAPRWRKATIFLNKGQKYALKVLYGNDGSTGILDVMWQDNVAAQPMHSFEPILA